MNYIPHSLTSNLKFFDGYCGAGGSSSGLKKAGIEGEEAVNHWKLAIETHGANHPEIKHYELDLMISNPAAFKYTDIAWMSPECTKHSRGQGKKRKNRSQLDFINAANPDPVAERSRVTMWDVVRFSEHHRYQVVIVENVVDVRDWEPFPSWLQAMVSLGYNYRECFFNSRFFHPLNGQTNFSPQNRDRLYVVFWRKGNRAPDLDFRPLAWCAGCERDVRARQVFKKAIPAMGEVLYDTTGKRGQYYYACPTCFIKIKGQPIARRVEPYYFAAYNIIDPTLPCIPIGEREKYGKDPLKPKTMNRIRIGLEKFGLQPLVIRTTYSHARNNRATTLEMPMPSQGTRQELAFILPMKGEDQYQYMKPSAEPLPTQTASGAPGIVVAPAALVEFYGGGGLRSISDPLSTVTAGVEKNGLLSMPMLVEFENHGDLRPITDVLNTVTSGGKRNGLLAPPSFLVGYYSRDDTATDQSEPIPTIPGENRFALIKPPFMTSYYNGSNVVHGIDEPVYTIPATERHALVVPEIDIDECGFRMLEPHELKMGQGFDRDYIILGSQKKHQVKQIGNAVSDPVAEGLGQMVVESLK